MLENLF